MENNNQKTYVITEDGYKKILSLISDKPFKDVALVYDIVKNREDSLVEDNVNALINILASFKFIDVYEFFSNINNYIKLSETQLNDSKEEDKVIDDKN